ncbi:MAG: hypothetical protein SGI77_06855 [Pirellulaceae bacterium]|nr:hypothetical protein [Pirellulaceae bacterium]
MTKRRKDDLTVGDDAFLDTVANLVGILIILVVIVSTGTHTAAKQISAERIKQATEELEDPVATAVNIEKDLARQEEQLLEHTMEVAYRNAERDAILQQVLMQKSTLDEESQKLDDHQREEIAQQQALSAMEKQLAELLKQQGEVQSTEKPPIILQHLPTPMAKTVFGKELHIMVRDGMVSVIPWDRMVAMLKVEAKAAVSRSTRREKIEEQLGPVEGYLMTYVLVSKRGLVSNGGATAMAQMIELDKFELDTTPEVNLEPIKQSLGSNGRLRIEMSSYPARETTVTAWVYPNSFETFRQLKELLFQEGYMTAARPMPEGLRIGASPKGSQSSAQ